MAPGGEGAASSPDTSSSRRNNKGCRETVEAHRVPAQRNRSGAPNLRLAIIGHRFAEKSPMKRECFERTVFNPEPLMR
jgi:hypothetical protein